MSARALHLESLALPMTASRSGGRAGSLPVPPTQFISRERELTAVCDLFRREDVRLVTLTGPGGVGKTRLAIECARTVLTAYPDGVVFVSLAPITDPDLVASAVAQGIGVRQSPDEPLIDGVNAVIGDRRLLLVLDNFEHVLDAAPFVADLLVGCSGLKVLVTSRARLRIRGEHECIVAPLDVPDAALLPIDRLESFGSVTLFLERTREIQQEFALTEANSALVAGICRRLDGLPLAIELAAARMKMLSPQALFDRLERRLPLLSDGARDLPARQQTMRDTIAWSYDLLHDEERQLYRHLATFIGGLTLEAAEACNPDLNVFDGIMTLVDHSLVRQATRTDGSTRFTMLETIREYGLEQLEQHGESAEARQRHARFFLDLVARAEPELYGSGQQLWLNILEDEHDNLRVALDWAVEHDVEAALRSAGGLWQFWLIHAHLSEGRRWLEKALVNGASVPASARAKALDTAGSLASWQGDFEQANQLFEESLRIFRELDDRSNIANTLRGLARMAMAAGDHERAHRVGSESVALYQALGDTVGIINALFNLGGNAFCQGEYARATALLVNGLTLAREQGNTSTAANIIAILGCVALDDGDVEHANQQFIESLVLNAQTADTRFIAVCFEGLGRVARTRNHAERAARLFGAAGVLRQTIGYPVEGFLRPQLERDTATVRSALGDERFATAWSTGQAMTLSDAIELALAADTGSAPDDAAWPNSATGLSPREFDVLRLLVDGTSNQEIAEALFISSHTVATHVANIMGKLGVESRTAAATYAIRRGLI